MDDKYKDVSYTQIIHCNKQSLFGSLYECCHSSLIKLQKRRANWKHLVVYLNNPKLVVIIRVTFLNLKLYSDLKQTVRNKTAVLYISNYWRLHEFNNLALSLILSGWDTELFLDFSISIYCTSDVMIFKDFMIINSANLQNNSIRLALLSIFYR